MFATAELQARESRRVESHKGRVSEEKEGLNPDAQLRRRAIGNERTAIDAGGMVGMVMFSRKELVLFPHTLQCPVRADLALAGSATGKASFDPGRSSVVTCKCWPPTFTAKFV